jgi:hypothetical protein
MKVYVLRDTTYLYYKPRYWGDIDNFLNSKSVEINIKKSQYNYVLNYCQDKNLTEFIKILNNFEQESIKIDDNYLQVIKFLHTMKGSFHGNPKSNILSLETKILESLISDNFKRMDIDSIPKSRKKNFIDGISELEEVIPYSYCIYIKSEENIELSYEGIKLQSFDLEQLIIKND